MRSNWMKVGLLAALGALLACGGPDSMESVTVDRAGSEETAEAALGADGGTIASSPQTWLFDFGQSQNPTPGFIDLVPSQASGVTLTQLPSSDGALTPVSLKIVDPFVSGTANGDGTQAPAAALGLPASATRDSFFGCDKPFSGQVKPKATLELGGLDPTGLYDLTFFASRMGVTDNRETEYTVIGAHQSESKTLDVANNTSAAAKFAQVQPSAAGVISIEVNKGPNNTNVSGFFYLGAMILHGPNHPPTANAGADVKVALPGTTATLTGSGLDSDGAIVSYAWTQLSGAAATLNGQSTSTLTVSGLALGSYAFRLTVTDDAGATASDDVNVEVADLAVTTLRPLGSTAAGYGYVEYLPEHYATTTATFPLMIVLHGVGERGNGTTQLSSVRKNGPNREIDVNGRSFPMVILTPQSPTTTPTGTPLTSWNVGNLDKFVTYALAHYRVDPKRVYLTGLSMGGGGVWNYAAAHGNRLAAIVPICGASTSGTDAKGAAIVNDGLPVWAAHAVDDTTVKYATSTKVWMSVIGHALGLPLTATSFDNYPTTGATLSAHFDTSVNQYVWVSGQDYRDANGTPWNPKYLMTIYRTGGHTIWSRMYSDQKVYDWMLAQARP